MLTFPNAVTVAAANPLGKEGLGAVQLLLSLGQFHPTLPDQATSSGFVNADEPDDITFDTGWSIGDLVYFGFRVDTKSVDAGVVKMMARARVREAGLTGRAAKAAEKEAVVEIGKELLRKALPAMKVTPVLWDTDTNAVYIGSASEKVVLAVQKALKAAAVEFVPPADWLGDRDAAWLNLTGLDNIESRGNLAPDVGPLFLRWLWWQSESAEGELPSVSVANGKIEWVARDGIEIQASRDKRIVVRAGDANEDPVVRVALVDGLAVTSLGLHLQRDGVTLATFTLGVDGGGLTIKALKPGIPCGSGDLADRAAAIANDLAHLYFALGALLRRFALSEGAPQNRGQADAALRRFLSDQVHDWTGRAIAGGRLEDRWSL